MGNTLQKTENQLTAAFKNNDQKVMQRVYQNVFLKFNSYALKNNGDGAYEKDVFQEAFVVCWRNIKENKIKETSNVEGYLLTIAKNKWIDHLRSSEFKKTIKTTEFAPLSTSIDDIQEEDSILEQRRTILRRAINELGETCKSVLSQFYFERKSMQEISAAIGITPASVRNQKYRCMEKLRDLSLKMKKNG